MVKKLGRVGKLSMAPDGGWVGGRVRGGGGGWLSSKHVSV